MTVSERFDPYLPLDSADVVKKMARLWAGTKTTRKEEAIAATLKALTDPIKVRQGLAGLRPFERNALGLAKLAGGRVGQMALGLAVYATGVTVNPYRGGNDIASAVRGLTTEGIFLDDYQYRYFAMYADSEVFSDERILAMAGAPDIVPITTKPAAPPAVSVFRSPPVVALEMAGILRAIQSIGGLGLTKNGMVRVTESRKLARAMHWPEQGLTVDEFVFHDPARAFVEAFRLAGLLEERDGSLIVAGSLPQFSTLPYPDQIQRVLQGFLASKEWLEIPPPFDTYAHWRARHGRLALAVMLAALPGKDFIALDDLDREFFHRIGTISAGGSYYYGDSNIYGDYRTARSNDPDKEAKRRAKARETWLAGERSWEEQALRSWAYFLGLVELGLDGPSIVSLRLTNLGRAILRPGAPISLPTAAPEAGAAWIVQPTFEIMVYMDEATPERMAFLERHAERVQVQQHVAQYRLTRESIYQALESGSVLDNILARLHAGSSRDLPQNVVQEIRSWAALRERVTVYRRANLIEYANGQQRQEALRHGAQGRPIGERFLLADDTSLPAMARTRMFDYSAALPACLSVSEDGLLTLTKPVHDLLIEHQLNQWAALFPPLPAGGALAWRLTQQSVAAAVKAGARIADLLNMLAQRSSQPLPAMLALSLKAWAGASYEAVLGNICILRCSMPDALPAILSSQALRPYLLGMLAPDVVVVDVQRMAEFKEILTKAGLQIVGRLSLNPFPK